MTITGATTVHTLTLDQKGDTDIRCILPDGRWVHMYFHVTSASELTSADVYVTKGGEEVLDLEVACFSKGHTNYRSSKKGELPTKVCAVILNHPSLV